MSERSSDEPLKNTVADDAETPIGRRRLLSGLAAAAGASLVGLAGRVDAASAQMVEEPEEYLILGRDNIADMPTGISNAGEGAAFVVWDQQSTGKTSVVSLASPSPAAAIHLETEGVAGIVGEIKGRPGAVFSSSLPIGEAITSTVGVVGLGEQGGGFFFHGEPPGQLPRGVGVGGFSPAGPGGVFSSSLPIGEAITSTVGVVGLGEQGGGFFFHGEPPGQLPRGVGVGGFSPAGPGGVFSSSLPIGEAITSTVGVVGLGEQGGGFFFHGSPGQPLPPLRTQAGIHGVTADRDGVGVLAANLADGEALRVVGRATFSRSGKAVVRAGMRSVTVEGVALTDASIVLAISQQPGAAVLWVALDVAGGAFTIDIGKAPREDVVVAWLVVN